MQSQEPPMNRRQLGAYRLGVYFSQCAALGNLLSDLHQSNSSMPERAYDEGCRLLDHAFYDFAKAMGPDARLDDLGPHMAFGHAWSEPKSTNSPRVFASTLKAIVQLCQDSPEDAHWIHLGGAVVKIICEEILTCSGPAWEEVLKKWETTTYGKTVDLGQLIVPGACVGNEYRFAACPGWFNVEEGLKVLERRFKGENESSPLEQSIAVRKRVKQELPEEEGEYDEDESQEGASDQSLDEHADTGLGLDAETASDSPSIWASINAKLPNGYHPTPLQGLLWQIAMALGQTKLLKPATPKALKTKVKNGIVWGRQAGREYFVYIKEIHDIQKVKEAIDFLDKIKATPYRPIEHPLPADYKKHKDHPLRSASEETLAKVLYEAKVLLSPSVSALREKLDDEGELFATFDEAGYVVYFHKKHALNVIKKILQSLEKQSSQ